MGDVDFTIYQGGYIRVLFHLSILIQSILHLQHRDPASSRDIRGLEEYISVQGTVYPSHRELSYCTSNIPPDGTVTRPLNKHRGYESPSRISSRAPSLPGHRVRSYEHIMYSIISQEHSSPSVVGITWQFVPPRAPAQASIPVPWNAGKKLNRTRTAYACSLVQSIALNCFCVQSLVCLLFAVHCSLFAAMCYYPARIIHAKCLNLKRPGDSCPKDQSSLQLSPAA
jgi:hypothetical protein